MMIIPRDFKLPLTAQFLYKLYKLPLVFNSDQPTSIVTTSIIFSVQTFVANENRCSGNNSIHGTP